MKTSNRLPGVFLCAALTACPLPARAAPGDVESTFHPNLNGPGDQSVVGLSLPEAGRLRARGRTTGGHFNGSSWLMETVADFTMVPAEPFRILSAVRSEENLLITFPTESGLTYTLWRSDSLTDSWTDTGLPFIVGDDTNQVFTVAAPVTGIPKRFYRVRARP